MWNLKCKNFFNLLKVVVKKKEVEYLFKSIVNCKY